MDLLPGISLCSAYIISKKMDIKLKNNFWSDNDNDNDDEKVINSVFTIGDIPLSSSTGKCVTANQFWLNVFKPKQCSYNKALERVKELLNTLDTSQLSSSMIEFNHYFSNDRYSIKKAVFKNDMLPRLQSFIGSNEDETKRVYALCLLLKLLFAEHESKKSKLAKVVVKAGLVNKLVQISQQNGTDLQSQKAIHALLSYLFFVIACNKKERVIRNLILNDSDVAIKSIVSGQKENDGIPVDAIWLLQYYPLCSKNYETLETLLATLKTLIENRDNRVVRESCRTLTVFARHSNNARQAIKSDKSLCTKLVDLLSKNASSVHTEEDIVTPIVAILAVILPYHNEYRNAFIGSGLLNGVNTLLNGCNCYRRYGCDIIKWMCMTPLGNRLNKPTDIIDRILDDRDVIPLLNQVLDQNSDMSLKYSAIYALFMLTYNANFNQIVALTNHGTLQSLCAQLTSTDNKYLHLVLVTLTTILISDFQEQLRNQIFPYPIEKDEKLRLIPQTIASNNGIESLTLITKRGDIDGVKEIAKNKIFAQDMLAYGFGVELRAPRRKPTAVVMDYQKGFEDCVLCNKKCADTLLFSCDDNALCKPCASNRLYKILIGEKPNECPVCKKEAKLSAYPFGVIRPKMHIINRDIEKEVSGEFVNEYPPIRKASLTIFSRK